MTNYNEDYQYDSCISRGICSVNPRTSSLQEILLLYLNMASYYALKLEENSQTNTKIKNLILNTISVMVSNPEFSENDFQAIVKGFNEELPALIQSYEELCKKNGKKAEYLKTPVKINKSSDIAESIRFGQKEYQKRIKNLNEETQDLYRIVFVLAKSICINILDLESFGITEGYPQILKLLNSLNIESEEKELKKIIKEASDFDNFLMKKLYTAKTEKYGKQQAKEVSYSTTKGKAILVVGSNIRELEIILEAFKDKEIDVYTHDEMILAHTFPKFWEYKNLKGQFGQGMENCLLDFATFPGPIILTRHSLYNVEHLYRGRLYTTDFASSKGVIRISNNNFSEVLKGIEDTKGFKTGKICEDEVVGYDFEKLTNEINSKIESFSRIFVIGINGYTKEIQNYFKKLLEYIPEDILVVSLFSCKEKNNIISVNACYDSFAMLKISEEILEKYNKPVTLFFPTCNRHTVSKMIYLSKYPNAEIFVGKCTPITLNPNLIFTLTKVYGIKGLSTPKKDLKSILEKK